MYSLPYYSERNRFNADFWDSVADEGRPISLFVANSFNSSRIFENRTTKYFHVVRGHNSRNM